MIVLKKHRPNSNQQYFYFAHYIDSFMNSKEILKVALEVFKKGAFTVVNGCRSNANFRTLFGFTISAVLLWLTLHNSGLKWESLALTIEEWLFFAASVLSFAAAVWIQSVRTRFIWQNEKVVTGKIQAYTALVIGNFYNSILPGNLGEGARAWYFSKKHQIPFPLALSVVFTEKWIDAQIFVFLTAALLLAMPYKSHYILYALINTALVVIVVAIIYYIVQKHRSLEKKLWLFILLFKKTGRFLYRMYWYVKHQISQLKQSRKLGPYIALGFIMISLNMLQFFFLFKVANIAAPVAGLYSVYLIALSMMIISVIPSAPGNIGVLHYGIYSALILSAMQFGLTPDSVALQSYARFTVFLHLSYFVPEVLLGVYYIVKERKIMFSF